MLLLGHNAPVTALLQCRIETESAEVDALVSAAEDGYVIPHHTQTQTRKTPGNKLTNKRSTS